MATWEARSNAREIRTGTPLLLYAKGQTVGQPRDQLVGPQNLWIELHNNWIEAKLVQANSQIAVLEMPTGEQWRLTPLEAGEFATHDELRGMYSEKWMVGEKLN